MATAEAPARVGSLCTGYGGLDRAVEMVIGGELAWVADNDPGAAAILAHRYPTVPNLGDITLINWAIVEAVDILTAGFPCQDVSCAGARRGLRAGTRTGVWAHVALAIAELRPSLVVLENVGGLLSEGADSDMERCPWCLGDAGYERAVRALGAVLGDLAEIGFDAEWRCVRASDAGAPHRRERVFIVAWPAADSGRHQPGRDEPEPVVDRGEAGDRPGAGDRSSAPHADSATGGERREPASGQAAGGRPRADAGRRGGALAADAEAAGEGRGGVTRGRGRRPASFGSEAGPQPGDGNGAPAAADSASDGRHEGRPESAGIVGGPDAAERGHGPASDSTDERHGHTGPALERGIPAAAVASAPAHAPGGGWGSDEHEDEAGRSDLDWRAYGPAIARWEHVTGRRAPRPTEPGRTGERLSPQFVEWLMGLGGGWVTDVPGLSRNAQLKALGNGVVPAQAALALSLLLPLVQSEAAA